jgi:hypothetical protein
MDNKNNKKRFPRFGFPNLFIEKSNSKKTKYELGNETIDVYEILSKKKSTNKNIRDISVLDEELEIV